MNGQDSNAEIFDVFLCHSSGDKPAVRQIAQNLAKVGINLAGRRPCGPESRGSGRLRAASLWLLSKATPARLIARSLARMAVGCLPHQMTRPRGSGRHLLKLSAFGSKLSSRRSSRWCSGTFAFFYWVAEFVLSTALDSKEFYEFAQANRSLWSRASIRARFRENYGA